MPQSDFCAKFNAINGQPLIFPSCKVLPYFYSGVKIGLRQAINSQGDEGPQLEIRLPQALSLYYQLIL